MTRREEVLKALHAHLAGLRGLPARLPRPASDAGAGKKRLRALADWQFGGGDTYCAACPGLCSDCPARMNAPLSVEGWQVWDLAGRLSGQLRAIPGAVLGWDMGAALALGTTLGIPALAIAELLPVIETEMIRRSNERISCDRGNHHG